MNIKFKLLLFIFLGVFSILVNGQSGFSEGYIITFENDTLYGLVMNENSKAHSNFCLFKKDQESKTIKYLPGEIKAYRIIDSKSFLAHKIFFKDEYNYVFLELLIEGKINLYYDSRNEKMSFYIEKRKGILTGLEITPFDIRPNKAMGYYNDQYDEITINIFKDTLYSLFDESSAALAKVKNLEYSTSAIMDITKTYINDICKGDPCIKFEKEIK